MKAALVALLAFGSVATAAEAALPRFNPKAPENSQILPSFNYAAVETVLNGIGARHQRAGTPGKPALLVSFPNNRKAVLMFGSCNAGGTNCKALSIQSFWTRIANAPPERTAAAIEAFNQRYSFAKAYVAADGRPALQRYLTADYGFIRGNLAVNLLVFSSQAEQFANEVLHPLETRK
jgi:hypothetical protein